MKSKCIFIHWVNSSEFLAFYRANFNRNLSVHYNKFTPTSDPAITGVIKSKVEKSTEELVFIFSNENVQVDKLTFAQKMEDAGWKEYPQESVPQKLLKVV